jgi:hypothetical protein
MVSSRENPGKRPLNDTEPNPAAAVPECPARTRAACPSRVGPPGRRTRVAEAADQSRSRRARGLLRLIRALGRGHGSDPEVRHHGQIAVRISDPVTLLGNRQPPSRDHDAHCVRVRLHACEQESDFNAVEYGADIVRRAGEFRTAERIEQQINVGFRVQSRLDMLSRSISEFDPDRTLNR